ncbi:MAG: peptidylprolyl isomerase [Candidatus Marsarchaeota archaeon]|jgi:FKBP-type peptidyl-prolyl cis-trans isomerase 2|nr:peptidylprolyl isomerase [Candidatus Marsarchaeota archaeon]
MSFVDGDFVEMEYQAWDADAGKLIATTYEESAKKEGIYSDKIKYGKVLVIVGSGGVIKGLDREIRKMSVGEEKEFTFKPEDAFGERSDDLVRVMPLSEFRAHDIDPVPGMEINIDNAPAIVKSVNSGRVVVDANNPYAGKNIKYKIKISSKLEDAAKKVEALGDTYSAKPSKVEVKGKNATLIYDSKVNKNADYFVGKASLIAALFTYMKEFEKVDVQEEYIKAAIESGQENEKNEKEA